MRCRPVLGLNSSAADAIGDVFRPRDGPTGKGARPRSADRGPATSASRPSSSAQIRTSRHLSLVVMIPLSV